MILPMKFMCDRKKAVLYGLYTAMFTVLFVTAAVIRYRAAAMLLLLLAVYYGFVFVEASSRIEIDENGVTQTVLFVRRSAVPWADIKEICILYANTFKRRKPNKTLSHCYIYFSETGRSNEERLSLCLSWPPKSLPYVSYSAAALSLTLRYSSSPIILFNVNRAMLYGDASVRENDRFVEIAY